MEEAHVVTCFLEHKGKILILQRSAEVGSYNARWAGVSGFIEPVTTPLEQAYREVAEETSLGADQLELVKVGKPLEVLDEKLQKKWVVHPFRFAVENPELVKIDWEHNQYKWIKPEDIKGYDTVPGLYAVWELVK